MAVKSTQSKQVRIVDTTGTFTAAVNAQGQLAVTTAAVSSGASTFAALGGTSNALLTSTAVSVKSSKGSLAGFVFYNPNNSISYVQMFNLATGSVTLGTTPPLMSFPVPANGWYDYEFSDSVLFSTAITVAATTTATGSTAPGTGITANIYYV